MITSKLRKTLAIASVALLSFSTQATAGIDRQAFADEIIKDEAVKDVTVTATGNIYVGLINNGQDRTGYAMYVCEVAREFSDGKPDVFIVKVIDIMKVIKKQGFHSMGMTKCTT